MDTNEAVAKALQVARVLQGMTYTELAEKSGVNIQTVYRIFGAKRDIKVEPLMKIAAALNTPISKIMDDAEEIMKSASD